MSWEQWLAIEREAKDPSFTTKPITSCPNDGEPLSTGPDGQPHCRYDGWRPNGQDSQ